MTHANTQKGEVMLHLNDGTERKMVLTLGAIEEIESKLGIDSLADLDGDKMGSSASLITILTALCRSEDPDLTADQVRTWPVNFKELMNKIHETFNAAGFTEDEDEDTSSEDKEPVPTGK